MGLRQKVLSLDSVSGGLEVSVPRGTSSVLGKLELTNADDPSAATCCLHVSNKSVLLATVRHSSCKIERHSLLGISV